MTSWLAVALLGGVVGLDATAFPQVMISRPLVAGTLTGLLFGRPAEGVAVGLLMELFALIVLPIGAARYPESGTATVAAAAAYMAASPTGGSTQMLVLALLFGLGWERIAGVTVVLQRRSNGHLLTAAGTVTAEQLERRHLGAMSLDFVRGAVVAATGALTGYGLLRMIEPFWEMPDVMIQRVLTVIAAGLLGTAIPLFGGWTPRRLALALGVGAGLVVGVVAW